MANPVKQGDSIRLTHVPGVGMGVQVNARPTVLIPGIAFAQAAWGTYFGPNHLGVALKGRPQLATEVSHPLLGQTTGRS